MNHSLAVGHLTDWNLLDWWIHYLAAIAVPLLATFVVVAGYLTYRAAARSTLPHPFEAVLVVILTVLAFVAVFLGLYWHIDLLYDTLRHTSSAWQALLAACVVAALFAAVSVASAVRVGIGRRRQLAAIAVACALPPVFSLTGDSINRAAISLAYESASDGREPLAEPRSSPAQRHPGRASTGASPRSPPSTVVYTQHPHMHSV